MENDAVGIRAFQPERLQHSFFFHQSDHPISRLIPDASRRKDSRRRESAFRREGDATFWGGFNLSPAGWLMLMHTSKQNGDIKITPE